MGISSFQKAGDKDRVLGSSDPAAELRTVIRETQKANMDYATQIIADIRSDPRLRLVDCVLVNEEGRVKDMWPTFTSYLNFPDTKPPPTAAELLNTIMNGDGLLYPLHSERYVQVFCRREDLRKALPTADESVEIYPYGSIPPGGFILPPPFNMVYVPDGALTPSEAKKKGLVLGSLGLQAISEQFDAGGDPDKIVRYTPRIYIGHGDHPAAEEVNISPRRKAVTLMTGHIPLDRRKGKSGLLRIEMDHSKKDVIEAIFSGYAKAPEVRGVPLILRYRPHAPWAGFVPQHGGSRNPEYRPGR